MHDIEIDDIETIGDELVTAVTEYVLAELAKNPEKFDDDGPRSVGSFINDESNLAAGQLDDEELREAFKQLDCDIDELWTEVMACEASFRGGLRGSVSIGISIGVRDRLERLGIDTDW